MRVLAFETRRAKEIATLISRQGGIPIVAPSVKERALEDHEPAFRFLDGLEGGAYDMVIFTTGIGLAFLREILHGPRLIEALRRVAIVSRGPKPAAVLREMGLAPQITVPEPNTWRQVVDAVAARPERRIAVQEYGKPNAGFVQALKDLGSSVTPVALYRWALPDDLEPLRTAVRTLAARECDVVLFTASVQLDHLLHIAADMSLEAEVLRALREDIPVASIGPVMTEALEVRGIRPRIVPDHPKLGALVHAIASAQGPSSAAP